MNHSREQVPEEDRRLQHMLEEVTAADCASGAPMDAIRDADGNECDVVGLRAAWLAFGRLLQAAEEAQPDDARSASEVAASISRSAMEVKSRLAEESVQTHFSAHEKKVRRLRRLTAIAAVAAAACGILIEVGVLSLNGWFMPVRQNPVAPLAGNDRPQPQIAAPPAIVNNGLPKVAKKMAPPNSAAAGVKEPLWDDSVESQITAVSEDIETVRQAWRHRVDDVDLVQYRIDEVSATLPGDAL